MSTSSEKFPWLPYVILLVLAAWVGLVVFMHSLQWGRP